jgi:hypothetical protein
MYLPTDSSPSQSLASEPLRRFLQVVRGAGVRISAAEGIDAARVVKIVGYGERGALKYALGSVLAKTVAEKTIFNEAFDSYFKREALVTEAFDPASAGDPDSNTAPPPSLADSVVGESEALTQRPSQTLESLIESNDAAGLASALESAALATGLKNIRYMTQKNLYVRRILDHMGLERLEQAIHFYRSAADDLNQKKAQWLGGQLTRLRQQIRDYVERQLLLFSRADSEQYREEILKAARLSNIQKRDLDKMRILVRQMAKRLAVRYAKPRRRRLRGQLDVRRTLRRNMGWGGIPFLTVWKQKRIEKPRVMVLCDVSGSVAEMAQFLLMFLYAINEVLADIRSFAFSGSLIEVSQIVESEPVERAIETILERVGFGSSDFGNSFADFEAGWMDCVTSKTTIIILGDARGNGNDPRLEIVSRLSQRAKRIVWLNPEYRYAWGTGDSDMLRYLPFCHVAQVCHSLRHLERAISAILEDAV